MANSSARRSRALRLLTPAAALLLGACATADIQKPIGRAGRLGAALCPVDGGLGVSSIAPGGPAEKARLRDGDLLVDYGDADLSKEEARKSLLWDLRAGAGKTLRLTAVRDGKPVRLKVQPEVKDVYPKDELYAVLSDEIMSGRKVSVAVVVTGIHHTKPEFFTDAQGLEAWKTGMGNSLKNNFENLLLNKAFLHCGNYSVADRDATDRVLKELGFQMTGAVSAETAKQVGRMTGASHLLFVDFTRFLQPSGGYEDDSSVRLVAVESDNVLASVRFRQRVDAR